MRSLVCALLLAASPASALALAPLAPLPAPLTQEGDRKAEYEAKRAAAEGDAAKLWELYDWCETYGLSREGRSVLRAIIEVDDARKAHELLGEIEYDGQWFASQAKVEAYKRKKLEAEAEASGMVVFEDRLVAPEDLPFLQAGMVKSDDGTWMSQEDHEKSELGWVRQDLEWVPPDEAGKIAEGLYRCGDEWLSIEDANAYHSDLGNWWRLSSDHYVVFSTASRDVAERAIWEAERVYPDYQRAFGREPDVKPMILVLNSFAQYNEFAGNQNVNVELRGFSSLHGAFLAEVWPIPYTRGLKGAGVCYWDSSNGSDDAFGRTFARHAAGQAYAEVLDPPSAQLMAGLAQGQASPDSYWSEKQLPHWFRYGVACYGERYFVDESTPENEGGPYALREWSIGNIARQGGLDPLERIFEFGLSLDDVTGSAKLINQAGLLVAFILDGECKPVQAKHLALKDAFAKGEGVEQAGEALEKALVENEAQLRTFAGI